MGSLTYRLVLAVAATCSLTVASSAFCAPLASLTFDRPQISGSIPGTRIYLSPNASLPAVFWEFDRTQALSDAFVYETDSQYFAPLSSLLTDDVDELLRVRFYNESALSPSGGVFASAELILKLESEWFGSVNLTGAQIDAFELQWDPDASTYGTGTIVLHGSPVPEPSTALLLGFGLVIMGAHRRRRML